MSDPKQPPQRVVCYIGGFNLYFGLIESHFRRYLWLNVHSLAGLLFLPHQSLAGTKYFTARITGARQSDTPRAAKWRNDKRKRQTTYLDALATVDGLVVFEGKYNERETVCSACGHSWPTQEEKMTDVNIATEMLTDAFCNFYDTAILISGDSDLVPPVRTVVSQFPDKRVIIAFPPGRHSYELESAASGKFVVGKTMLRRSQFPDSVTSRSGFTLRRPPSWA